MGASPPLAALGLLAASLEGPSCLLPSSFVNERVRFVQDFLLDEDACIAGRRFESDMVGARLYWLTAQ